MQRPKPTVPKAGKASTAEAGAATDAGEGGVATSDAKSKGTANFKTRKVERDAEKRPDWGELNTGKPPPQVYVLDVSTGVRAGAAKV